MNNTKDKIYAKKKILIVDDDPIIIESYSDYFKNEGYNIATASNGEDGVKQVREFNPDLILLDIIMPKMDGISMLKKLKQNPKTSSIPIIMLTNLESKEGVAKAVEAGTDYYLIKVDYSLKELDEKVRQVLK